MKDNQEIQDFFERMPMVEPPSFEGMWGEVTYQYRRKRRKKIALWSSAAIVALVMTSWFGWQQYELYQAKEKVKMEFAEDWSMPSDALLIHSNIEEDILNWNSPTGGLMKDF